ncbi:MAG: large repetitive protein, partial [Chloroflexota bacterium]|nr:large repetitive protein [Chloroflexota bacterium]
MSSRRRRRQAARLLILAVALSLSWSAAPASAEPFSDSGAIARSSAERTGAVPDATAGSPERAGIGNAQGRPPPRRGANGDPLSGAAPCASVPGRYLVRFAAGASRPARAAAVTRARARKVRGYAIVPGLELVKSSLPAGEAVASLGAQQGVESVELDCIVKLDQVPNDPSFGQQWALANTGQTDGTPGADIRAVGGWAVRNSAANVTAAIIDTGMQLNHPDLAANLWRNVDEIAGNHVDDDHNGYVDDVHGWDFVNDDAVPDDDNGHGTHVAGTLGAVGNNGIGVSGVAWSVRLMPVKAFDANGSGNLSAIIAALDYAVDNGARVSNHSYSGTDFVRAEYDAFAAAGARGHLAIAAAGNEGLNSDESPSYPGAFRLPGVVTVAATTDTDDLADFSNFGLRSVQVGAPGTNILSTYPGSTYARLDGTSMATPHVTGVAALVAAQHPTWTGSQIRDRILGTTRAVAGLSGVTWTGGVVDAAAALSGGPAVLPPPAPPATPHALATEIDAAQVPPPVAAPTAPTFRTPVPVETSQADLGAPRIALDAAGEPLIAYVRRFQGVQLLTRSGTGWSDRKLTSAYDDFYPIDVAIDGSGLPTVAVQREWSSLETWTDPGVVLVGATPGTPTERRISASCPDADACFSDAFPAIAYDLAGHAHVVFSRATGSPQDLVTAPAGSAADVTGAGLYYATNATGGWVVRRLTSEDDATPAAIAVEPD